MSNEIKPIETIYNGYKFRSRLEARWAVFFDAMGIKYEYEPEGIEVDDERYLPDFYFPDYEMYGEVKGDRPGWKVDIVKMMDIYESAHGTIPTIIFGNIPKPYTLEGIYWFPAMHFDTLRNEVRIHSIFISEYGRIVRDWMSPKKQNRYQAERNNYKDVIEPLLESDGDWTFVDWKRDEEGEKIPTSFIQYPPHLCEPTPQLYEAFSHARQARFEHGETPRIKEE